MVFPELLVNKSVKISKNLGEILQNVSKFVQNHVLRYLQFTVILVVLSPSYLHFYSNQALGWL